METDLKPFMSGAPITVEANASALAALELMIDHGIRHLPVVDAQRRVSGVLSFDDLRAAFPIPVNLTTPPSVDERFELRDVAVGEVMTYGPVTLRSGSPLEDAAELMAERRIGCLPIVDENDRLEGILTETDLLHALVTLLWAERRGGREGERPSREGALVDALRGERNHLAQQLGIYEQREREITRDRREQPLDLVEHGADVTEANLTEELAEMAARRLGSLDHALERAERGELGICEECNGEISEGRMRALPGTSLCIACARQAEQVV